MIVFNIPAAAVIRELNDLDYGESTSELIFVTLATLCCQSPSVVGAADAKPNVVQIYTVDLGYGDVGCYGACDAFLWKWQCARDG